MTNSTDNSKNKKEKKIPKKNGPIRFEAIIPVAIVVTLMVIYFILFFDSHLKSLIEYGATIGNGAEVNLASAKTSFIKGSAEFRRLQITNEEAPSTNLLEIDRIYFEFSWDALLRAKFVIVEASIKNLQIETVRKRPGRVLPKPPPSPGMGDKAATALLKFAGEQFKSNVLGDFAQLLQGQNPLEKLKELEGGLKASTKAKELEQTLKIKEKEWQKRIKELPHASEFEQLLGRLNAVKKSGWKTPQEFQESLKQIETIVKEADQKVKNIQSTSQQLNSDIGGFEKSIASLDQFIKDDLKDLESRLKIPSLDVQEISKNIFGDLVQKKLGDYSKYIEMGQKYMPPKKFAGEKPSELTPHERAKGRNYKFGRPNSYPLFWLKKASLSSESSHSPFGGDVLGQILNVTNDQTATGIPTKIEVKGDFPSKNIKKLEIDVTLDHRTETAFDQLKMSVGSFPLQGRTLTQTNDIKIAFNRAVGSTKLLGELKGKEILIESSTNFDQIEYEVESKNKDVKDILTGVVKDVPHVSLLAGVVGTFDHLKWNVKSNLGEALQKGFEKQIKAKIEEAKKKLEAFVNNEVNKYRSQVQAELNKIKGQVEQEIQKIKDQADKAKTQAENQVNQSKKQAENQARQQITNDGKKVLDQLKKKIKF